MPSFYAKPTQLHVLRTPTGVELARGRVTILRWVRRFLEAQPDRPDPRPYRLEPIQGVMDEPVAFSVAGLRLGCRQSADEESRSHGVERG